MSENTEHDAFANAVKSEQDALANVLEELIYNSAMSIAQGQTTPKSLKSSLIEQGISPKQAKYIIDEAIAMSRNAVEQVKKFKKLSQSEEPWYLPDARRQANAEFDRDFINTGFLVLIAAAIILGVFGIPTHARGQGLLTVAVLVGIGAIAFGIWGRIKDAIGSWLR